jgi:hypothetical protein
MFVETLQQSLEKCEKSLYDLISYLHTLYTKHRVYHFMQNLYLSMRKFENIPCG